VVLEIDKTGAEIYGKQRIDPVAGAFTASPWAYNGKIFALSEDGDTFVIQAGPEFKVLGKNPLDEMCLAFVGLTLDVDPFTILRNLRPNQ